MLNGWGIKWVGQSWQVAVSFGNMLKKSCEITAQLYFWWIVGVCESIKMRECDGGTAWDRVESKSYPLTSPDQSIQVRL